MTTPGTHYDYTSVYTDFIDSGADSRYVTSNPDATPASKRAAVVAVAAMVKGGATPAEIKAIMQAFPIDLS